MNTNNTLAGVISRKLTYIDTYFNTAYSQEFIRQCIQRSLLRQCDWVSETSSLRTMLEAIQIGLLRVIKKPSTKQEIREWKKKTYVILK